MDDAAIKSLRGDNHVIPLSRLARLLCLFSRISVNGLRKIREFYLVGHPIVSLHSFFEKYDSKWLQGCIVYKPAFKILRN